jgi:hypothetical protein
VSREFRRRLGEILAANDATRRFASIKLRPGDNAGDGPITADDWHGDWHAYSANPRPSQLIRNMNVCVDDIEKAKQLIDVFEVRLAAADPRCCYPSQQTNKGTK